MINKFSRPGIGQRISSIRGNLTFQSFAVKLGVSAGFVSEIEKGVKKPSAEMLYAIAKEYGININWLLTGEGLEKGRSIHEDRAAWAQGLDKDFVLVPRYDVQAGAGGGSLIHSEQIVDYLAFKTEWVQNVLGASINNLALISVRGDSMEPTLSNDDLILIDLRFNKIDDSAIYALNVEGLLLVKRIQIKLDGTAVVKSDNAFYEPEIVTGDALQGLYVIGRVVWIGRRA